jgi:hypothetical protein
MSSYGTPTAAKSISVTKVKHRLFFIIAGHLIF